MGLGVHVPATDTHWHTTPRMLMSYPFNPLFHYLLCLLHACSFPIHLPSYSSPFLFISYSRFILRQYSPNDSCLNLFLRYSSTAMMMAATAGDPANAARTVQLLLTMVGDAVLHFQVRLIGCLEVLIGCLRGPSFSRYSCLYIGKNVIDCSLYELVK